MECFGVVHVRNAWKTAKKKGKKKVTPGNTQSFQERKKVWLIIKVNIKY